MIVSGSRDGKIGKWNAKTAKEIGQPLEGHGYDVNSVVISTQGDLIVSANWREIRRWNSETGKQIGKTIHRCEFSNSSSECLAISTQGDMIVSGDHHGRIRVWTVKTKKEIKEERKEHTGTCKLF